MILSLVLGFLKNPLFLAAALSWLAAQLFKLILQLIKGGDTSRLLTGGGMPSSHTATMIGLAIETALVYGTSGFEFPMAFFFMIMVVYDALNVRYVTGEQNKILNHMIEDKKSENAWYASLPRLKELLGHTLPEVIVGAVIGAAVAIALYNLYVL